MGITANILIYYMLISVKIRVQYHFKRIRLDMFIFLMKYNFLQGNPFCEKQPIGAAIFLFILLVTQELFWSLGVIQSLQVNAGIAYDHPKLISYLTYIQGLRWDEGFLQQTQGPSGETPSPKPAGSFTAEQHHPGLFIWASENLGLFYFFFFCPLRI